MWSPFCSNTRRGGILPRCPVRVSVRKGMGFAETESQDLHDVESNFHSDKHSQWAGDSCWACRHLPPALPNGSEIAFSCTAGTGQESSSFQMQMSAALLCAEGTRSLWLSVVHQPSPDASVLWMLSHLSSGMEFQNIGKFITIHSTWPLTLKWSLTPRPKFQKFSQIWITFVQN